jgi:hypothetical protein
MLPRIFRHGSQQDHARPSDCCDDLFITAAAAAAAPAPAPAPPAAGMSVLMSVCLFLADNVSFLHQCDLCVFRCAMSHAHARAQNALNTCAYPHAHSSLRTSLALDSRVMTAVVSSTNHVCFDACLHPLSLIHNTRTHVRTTHSVFLFLARIVKQKHTHTHTYTHTAADSAAAAAPAVALAACKDIARKAACKENPSCR